IAATDLSFYGFPARSKRLRFIARRICTKRSFSISEKIDSSLPRTREFFWTSASQRDVLSPCRFGEVLLRGRRGCFLNELCDFLRVWARPSLPHRGWQIRSARPRRHRICLEVPVTAISPE